MTMTAGTVSDGGIIVGKPKWRPLESEGNLAMLLLLPTIALLLMFIAYPFVRGILLAVTNSKVGVIGDFVGFENFARLLKDPIFHAVVYNTFLYTFVTTVFKLILGLWLALLLNRDFKFKAFTRAFILLPFIVPTVLACFAWKWMFDPTFSVLNWMLFKLGVVAAGAGVNWLGDGDLAMLSIMIVNIWRGVPFFAISLLAGLQTISQDMYEAAAIDGANAFQRFRHVTLPLIMPVLTIVTLFSVIWTFADFQLVYVLTRGGPTNSTHLLATLAYQIGMSAGELSNGAAISLWMFPFMAAMVVAVLWYQRREGTQ